MTLGSPGIAHPHPEGETKERTERVIIMSHKGDGGRPSARRASGPHPTAARMARSSFPTAIRAGRTEVNEGGDDQRTRIILCTRGNASPAERAERLQRARDRLAGDDDLSAEQRARISAALDREIARLRGQ